MILDKVRNIRQGQAGFGGFWCQTGAAAWFVIALALTGIFHNSCSAKIMALR